MSNLPWIVKALIWVICIFLIFKMLLIITWIGIYVALALHATNFI